MLILKGAWTPAMTFSEDISSTIPSSVTSFPFNVRSLLRKRIVEECGVTDFAPNRKSSGKKRPFKASLRVLEIYKES